MSSFPKNNWLWLLIAAVAAYLVYTYKNIIFPAKETVTPNTTPAATPITALPTVPASPEIAISKATVTPEKTTTPIVSTAPVIPITAPIATQSTIPMEMVPLAALAENNIAVTSELGKAIMVSGPAFGLQLRNQGLTDKEIKRIVIDSFPPDVAPLPSEPQKPVIPITKDPIIPKPVTEYPKEVSHPDQFPIVAKRQTPSEILDQAAAVLDADERTTKIDTVTRKLYYNEWTPKILALQAQGMTDADIIAKVIKEDY